MTKNHQAPPEESFLRNLRGPKDLIIVSLCTYVYLTVFNEVIPLLSAKKYLCNNYAE